jgi:hypothetical protein
MARFQRFTVAFDDGRQVEVQGSSRDLLALEKQGVDVTTMKPVEGSYVLAYAALVRAKAKGLIDVDLPDSADELMDCADLAASEDDPEGEGSGQGQATG